MLSSAQFRRETIPFLQRTRNNRVQHFGTHSENCRKEKKIISKFMNRFKFIGRLLICLFTSLLRKVFLMHWRDGAAHGN